MRINDGNNNMEITQQELDRVCQQLGEAFKKDSDELTQADYDAHCIAYFIINQDRDLWIN